MSNGIPTPMGNSLSTEHCALIPARILYLTGAAPQPVDNPTALPLAAMRARRARSCQ